jgi:hypothetical protein
MGTVERGDERASDGIDLDRVIIDPDYRRRVLDRLRAQSMPPSPPIDPRPVPASGRQD